MSEKTPAARTPESAKREQNMRRMAPTLLERTGTVVESRMVRGMQFVEVQPTQAPRMVVWVKCAWKPGNHGNCAVQMAFPGKEERAHTGDEVIRIVSEKAERAGQRGATHLLLLAADDEGLSPLAAFLVPIGSVRDMTIAAVQQDEPMTQNGASPSFYVTAAGPRQAALVDVVRRFARDVLISDVSAGPVLDALEDLDDHPIGLDRPDRIRKSGYGFQRDPAIRFHVVQRSHGTCEYCGKKGFLMVGGGGYVEAHHIIALADQGPDTLENVIALCPEHHRAAHYGAKRDALEAEMKLKLLMILKQPVQV